MYNLHKKITKERAFQNMIRQFIIKQSLISFFPNYPKMHKGAYLQTFLRLLPIKDSCHPKRISLMQYITPKECQTKKKTTVERPLS